MSLDQEVAVLVPALSLLPIAVMTTDCKGIVRWVNRCFTDLTGYAVDEIAGQNAEILVAEDQRFTLQGALQHVITTGQSGKGEWVGHSRGGDVYGVDFTITPIKHASDAVTHVLWTLQRRNERKHPDDGAGKGVHERFQRIIESTEAGYFRIGLDGCYEDVNAAWLGMHQFADRRDVIGLHFSAAQVPDDVAKAAEVVRALTAGERARAGEFSRLRRDGTIGYHTFSASPVREGDRVIGLEGFLVDISDRKKAEQERQQTEQQYRALFDSMLEGVAVHRLLPSGNTPGNYKLLEVNRRYEQILGVRREDVVNQLATVVYGTSSAPYFTEFASVVESGKPLEFETYFAPMKKHFQISVTPMGGDCFATIFFDITKRKRDEEALRESREQLRLCVEHTPAPIAMFDREMRYLAYNRRWIADYKLPDEDLTGRSHYDVFPEIPERWKLIHQRCLAGEVEKCDEDPFIRANGEMDWIRWEIHPWLNGKSEIGGIIIFSEQISDRKRSEARLMRAQKLESVGRLAGGVAHDFNNLLTVINGYSAFLLNELKAGDPLRVYAEEIGNAGNHAAGLTKQLLAFSRKEAGEPRVLNLNATIEESAPMLQRLIGEDIMLKTHLDGSLGPVMADPDQIHRVIMNLAVNSRDAMPDGGTLDIETSNVEIDQAASAPMHRTAAPGRYVRLTVTDNGEGMDEKVKLHIFEPFFTTKEVGKGTGLGLSTVYGIVQQSGGWIDVQSEVGVGTSFRMYFPRTTASAAPGHAEAGRATGKGVETILVVEDQAAVRGFTVTALRQLGYQVLEAPNGDEAIGLAQRHAGRIDLLVTDVVMPGMNGRELSERLRAVIPGLKVLLVSGYAADVLVDRGATPDPGLAFLRKPFRPGELAQKVREVLSEGA